MIIKPTEYQLYHACTNGDISAVSKLLNTTPMKININCLHNICGELYYGETVLYVACKLGNCAIVNLLLQVDGINLNEGEMTPLYAACENGDIDIVQMLLSVDGVDVNQTNGYTPLYIACLNGHFEIVKLLLQQVEIDVNKGQQTPLYAACLNGRVALICSLLNRKDIQIDKGMTRFESGSGFGRNVSTLCCMLENENLKIAKLLLFHGAKVTEECMEVARLKNIDMDLLLSQVSDYANKIKNKC